MLLSSRQTPDTIVQLTHERVPVARQLAEAYCTLDAEAVAADWASKERNLPPTYVTIIGWVLGLLPVRSHESTRRSLFFEFTARQNC